MQWLKKGLIYGANDNNWWMNNSALQPTPIVIGNVIRIFVGFRDANGVGRVGFVDVDAENPSNVLKVKDTPCLDIGEPGCFDDNGVVPCAITRVGEKLYLFYAGYNIGYHVRMTIFSGLAISEDNGETFHRVSNVPAMERIHNETLFRVVHTALYDNGEWKMYYGAGSKFIQGEKKTLPIYEIKLLQTNRFDDMNREGDFLLKNEGEEYRIARPYVIKDGGKYKMFFCKGTKKITYRLAYAESSDGISWVRKDDELNLDLSKEGWDSEMMAYPAFVKYKNKSYLFYNGNNYGYAGFGYAELTEE